jgi:hypothetical protein
MARLIPRKQIEEQQNISGSFRVGEDINIGNNVIISGSIFVSQSFFFGSDTGSRNEITGSVYLTGSLIIDGELRTGAPNTILSVTSSNALVSVDTQKYAGILAKDFGSNLPTLYVSSTDGDDTNDGRSIQYPLRTIKRAAALSTPGYDGRYGFDTGSIYNGYVIKVQAGTYLEDNPVVLPKNTTVWGAGLRITKINAKNPTEDLFWVNSGCYIAEVTMGGLRLYPDQINPEKGFGVAFQPGAFITTSPYVQNCSQISNQENSFTELYEDIPPGGGGLYVNGDVIDPDSPLASMVLDAYTQISPNGVGCLVNGRGFIQLVSFFNNFSYYAIRVNNGGHATLNNSNISFGLYGMYASGSRFISGSGGNTAARDSVRATWSVIVDVLNKGLEDGLPTITKLNTDEGIRLTSPALYTQSRESANTALSSTAASEISADYKLIASIVENGTANFPTLLAQSSNKGYGFESPYNILGGEQITSSISATNTDLTNISGSYAALLSILANGTGSFTFKSNNEDAIKVTSTQNYPIATASPLTASVSSSFGIILNILKTGLSATPTLIPNNSSSIKIGNVEQFTTGVSSSFAVRESVSASFGIVYNVLQNGTGSNILPIPENHQRVYTIVNSGSIGFKFNDANNSLNPTLTLFRGETYKFNVDATEDFGGVFYPFWIRTAQIADIGVTYDYNKGVVNNGDSTGTITFTVPYDAPNTLYYVADNNSVMGGKLNIVNSSTTPRYLIANTLTYPETIYSSSIASTNVDKINAYDLLIGNKELIKDEVILFVSSSWSNLDYNKETCKRDVGYIIDGVAKDLLYGGNEESIRSALYYYIYPSSATTTQKEPTTSAVKYALGLTQKLLSNRTLQAPDNDKLAVADCILDNRLFVQNETIAFISSSWSGADGFYYNEEKCKRDVGYILDAVATDALYGGNERAITAAKFYYLYPSAATVAGVPSSTAQLEQTLTGIRYAAGIVDGLLKKKTFQTASASTQAAYSNLKSNKELIQNETIEFINVTYPQLKYNQTKCRRDVGYIIDSVATDLLYGGNERGVVSGRNYYAYPSIATSIQRKETIGGVRYAKIIGDYIVQNIILDTPRVVNNDERNIRVTTLENVTSSFSGTTTQQSLISSSFSIVEGIIKGGLQAIPSVLAQNTNQNWGVANPLNVTTNVQTTSSYVTPNEINTIDRNFGIVTNIIDNGISVEPVLTSSLVSLIKVTDIEQVSATAATNNETASISSSFAYVMNVISGGLGQLNSLVSNLSASIVVTNTSFVSSTAATGSVGTLISSSMSTIATIISGGLSVVPKLTSSLANNIKVTNTSQYISASYSGSLEDVSFVSSSIAIVTNIIKGGSSPAKGLHTSSLSTVNARAAYQILKQNIPFIQNETIAYLSSSWAGFDYDEVKCKRDVGLIISGAAEDLIFNSNSASIVNGEYYYEFPSQATDSQLNQTLDGINYASRLAQKLIQNIPFTASAYNNQNADTLLRNNKVFIQNETIAYMSSSWGSFDYNEAKCRRDVGYIIDAVRTDIVYGGNERTIEAGRYYFLYPSEATNTQLQQTTDAINYASRLAQKVVANTTFVAANTNTLRASNLLSLNKSLIASEVVEYVSSSWSGVQYNEQKCKRDVGYILDAVRTDLVYGGNERTTIAGQYYYLFPSAATVGGEPTATQQLDPTITGVNYARRLAQNIVLNKTLVSPTQAVLDARELVKTNTTFIQQNVIEYISDTYPTLNYKVDKCFRDVRFIVDGVLTDLVYGGNERSLQSGEFYYKYPSLATGVQSEETIDAINFAKELTKLIAIGGKAIEDGFDIVTNIISSGSVAYPTLVSNTLGGIRATIEEQYIAKKDVISSDKTIVSSSFGNVINIIDKGVSVIPTIVSSTNKGVGRISGTQITSSINVEQSDKNLLGSSFDIILDIVESGTGSIPTIVTNAIGTTKVTTFVPTTGTTISSSLISSTTSSFNIVLDIIENGTGSMASLVTNANSLVKVTGGTQYTTGNDASSKAGLVTSSFNTILDIIENGTSVIPTLVENTTANIRFGGASTSGTPATSTEANTIGTLFDIVTGIVENGTGSMATLIPYTTPSSNTNVLNAYANLKANITFIQNETIAYLSSSWSTASYDETKCKRDVGLIVSGAAEDLLFNANSASLMNGKFYYLYPSQAETTQLNQTLDGINYAKRLAKKIVVNTTFVPASNESYYAKDLLINNKGLIANEVVAYISSSWTIGDNTSDPYFYNETTCKRDVGYILDAVATDIFYGGNERSSKAGEFYYLYPSQATGYQLDQTLDGVRYAKNIAEKIVKGNTLVSVSQQKLDARTTIDNNRTFIAEEVVAYVSSSWRDFDYNESKCKRDVGYILDAVKTDLVYGGNERSRQAGEYYYKYPSTATGAQLAPTLTGIKYAKGLVLEVLANNAFQTASLSKQTAYDLLVDNKLWIQNQTIAKINANLDTITYNEATCKRDVGYIVDAVATDILYGGNERSAEAGEFYYLYPSAATGSQLAQTLEGIGYAKSLSNSVIANELVYTQTTSSITPITTDINKVGTGFDIVLDIIANGTGSIPSIFTNASSSIKRTNSVQYITTASIASTYLTNANSAFDVVLNVVENGTGSLPSLIRSVNSLVKLTTTNQYSSSINVSGSRVNSITSSFNTVINILENGTGSLPTSISNTFYNTKVTNTPQYISGSSATSTEATLISQSIAIVTNVIANGTTTTLNALSLPTSSYGTAFNSNNRWIAYGILKNNITFIQDETIAYLSSSWSTASYDEAKCRRDIGLIVSGAAEDLIFNSNSASVVSAKYYYEYPSQAQGAQLNQTLDGIFYASKLAQKVILNTQFSLPTTQTNTAYDLLINNKGFIQNETIAYISSSWSNKQYNETTCKRDVGYILDAIATDVKWGGNERTITAGVFYYKYPSAATGSQLKETVTGVTYAKNLADKLLRNAQFQKISQNKLQAKDLIVSNKNFIANEVIAYVSASWTGFYYNETTCKRDVGYILDAVATDIVYGGNERSYEAGRYYYYEPSTATTTQLGPTLSGIQHAKGVTQQILKNSLFVTASNSAQTAYELLVDNKDLIQTETIGFLNSAWSFFDYNEAKCRRDVGYIVDAVATDILYGGNEASARAGEYYYLYPSLATVEGDGNESGQLDQTLDGVKYAKGIAQKIVANTLLKKPTISEKTGFDLLINNKQLIQKETIAYISSSWSGVGSFSYNEASCSRDVAYILDNVATDLIYGGNERSSKAGEYYYLYPSKATVISSISPDTNSQKGPTIDGIAFAAGLSQTILNNTELIQPTDYVKSAVSLLKANRTFIQNETIQYIDAFFPYLTYLREKCRRDVGYIVDGVATDLFYGGNQRSITSGDYYFRYPNKATTSAQLSETVSGIEYAKAVSKKVAQNIILTKPEVKDNTSANIKATNTNQYTSSINVSTTEISKISSSFSIVTDIIKGGVQVSPTKILNTNAAIKVTGLTPTTSSINGGNTYADLVTSSFNLVRDIINYGEAGIPDALARNYDYGFQLATPTLLHISSTNQTSGGSVSYTSYTSSISSSFANVINIVNNGISSIPAIIDNTSGSIKVQSVTSPIAPSTNGGTYEKNTIGNLYGIVTKIIETQTYPTFVSNTSASIKVTNTPQLISGSGAQRLQSKLVSSSFAVVSNIILNGTGSQTYVAPSATANSNPKITSAYNLLLGNKNMIIDETIAYMSSSWSTFDYNETKCRRDLGYIIDGAASDLIYGGNSGSFLNGQFYALIPSLATSSQLDQTLTAIRYASGISEKVVQNTTLQHISASLTTSASYVALRANKQFIQSESIAYVSSSWSEFSYNETTCKRDIGYIIDAVSTDLLYGGNERSWIAGDYYYRYPSNATTSELQPTLDGVIYAKGISMGLVTGSSYSLPVANVSTIYTLLKNNKEFVQNEVVAFVNAKYPYLYYDQTKCRRDIGYIVDAVITDFKYGGNLRSSKAGEFYYKYPSLATESEQVVETTAAIDYARRLMQQIVIGNTIQTPSVVSNTFNNIKVTAFNQTTSSISASAYEVNRISSSFAVVTNIVENGLGAIPTLVSNTSQSIKFTTSNQYITGSEVGTAYEASLISASISIVTNIVANGVGVAGSPVNYTTPSTASNVYYAYNLLKQNIGFIQNETIAYISSSWSTSSFSYDESKCKRDVGLIISGALEDMLFGVASASIVNGKFYFESASQATGTQLNQTLDGLFFASKVAQKVLQNVEYVTASIERRTAWELLNSNKSFIAAETVAYISSSWVTGSNSDVAFLYNDLSCSRDVKYILDNVATDILYGGNERTIKAGSYYFLYPSAATGSQLDETLEGIKYAGQLAEKIIVNTLFVTASATASAVHTALKANKPFIQAETIAFVSSSWAGLTYTESKCRRDVGLIIDAVATDILYGGNQRSATAGQYYFKYPSQATGSQLDSTLNAIDFAGGTAKNVITNTTFVTASQSVSASVELLRNNRLFIQNETMAYLTASWSSFEYNKDKCKRDIGYIIDGVATDILYGGNERSVMSGDFYYKYPSKATLLGDGDGVGQLGQTLDGIIYASRVAQKVAQNTQFVTASSAVSASFDLLRKNKNFIAAETIAYVSSSWSGVYYNEASCSRDVKYIIDAAATDVFYGGTERSVTAGSYYFLFPSKATVKGVPSEAAQLDPTITGVRYAGKLASKIVTNPKFVLPSASLLTTTNLLTLNKNLIQKETITFLSSSWSTLKYNEVSCSRDLGFIIDAIRTDLVYGGNERSIEAGSYYYKIPSVAIQPSYTDNGTIGQKIQTVDGIDFARGLSEKIVANTLLTYLAPATKRRQAAERLRGSKDELKQRAIGYTNGAFPYLVYNEASCSRDTGLIVDACCTDLLYGGNERGIAAASSYYTGQYGSAIAVTRDQLLETLETNRYLRTRAEFIAAGAPVEAFGSLIVATGIDYSYNGSGVTFKALPPNQGGSGVANPLYEITELGGGRIYFTSGNETGDFRIGTGLSINQATGTLVGRTFSKSLFSLVTPFSLALQI